MRIEGRRHTRVRRRHSRSTSDAERDLPLCTVTRSHPVTGLPVVFHYRDVSGDSVWTVVMEGRVLGTIVRPYSVLDEAPPVYVALLPDVRCLAAGLFALSWRDALDCLEAHHRRA